MTPAVLAELEADIRRRHGSVYAFSKKSGIHRALISLVLRGKYGGNMERQVWRIRAALDGEEPLADMVYNAVKRAMCARCPGPARCENCKQLFKAVTHDIVGRIRQRY